jgi:hypothetical protein
MLVESCHDEAGVFVDDARQHFEGRQRERGIEMPVLERSPEGLSFRVAPEACLLAPGTPLEEAEIVCEGVVTALPHAVVRHLTPEAGSDGVGFVRVGVSFGVPWSPRAALASPPPPAPARRGPLARLRARVVSAWTAVQYALYKGRARLAPEADRSTTRRLRIRGRPHEIAASLDGRSALANGSSRWITGEAAREDGHRFRARACAILTGIGTVRHDDPELTVRAVPTPRQPLRVVVDRDAAGGTKTVQFPDLAGRNVAGLQPGDWTVRAEARLWVTGTLATSDDWMLTERFRQETTYARSAAVTFTVQ